MNISEEQVKNIANLAKLHLTPEEIKMYSKELTEIVSYFEQLNELDTSSVEENYSLIELNNVFRDDEAKESLKLNEVLMNASIIENNYFKVPKMKGAE